ncbi:guanine deaminase isoform X2 [Sitophilus oryzae]|uniref:guanine deaminase n=1 Tax=Sitophilus oryzae TaxID=7048 RepID=A0A6J2Y986_SITOR|nr:guanine deaminase isoform X2 [Sitophilus oryzae]
MTGLDKVFIGKIVNSLSGLKVEVFERGYVTVRGRQIIDIGNLADKCECLDKKFGNVERIQLKNSQILIPGFVDTHIHAPQYPNCGLGYDKTLLDWLDAYTYKLERVYRDSKFSKDVFDKVVKKCLDHGTTTACYYGPLFNSANVILTDSVEKYGQRALIGKVTMTQSPYPDYVEGEEEFMKNITEFVRHVLSRQNDLIQPIITPRFALSLNSSQMRQLGDLAESQNLHIQTHIAENKDEIRMVQETYNKPYARVYDDAKLLTNKTVLAHGIYLTDEDLDLIAERNTGISHCPDSNTCLKSGLCDVKRLLERGIKVGLGSDVSGGPVPSIRQAMKSALDTSVHLSFIKDNYEPLTYDQVFCLATIGGAEVLHMQEKIGNFAVNKEFDALIVDVDVESCQVDDVLDRTPLEILQKFVYCGDDRNVVGIYVAGRKGSF